MPKNAVFPYMMFTQFIDEPSIKRLSLIFDKIFISENRLSQILSLNPRTDSEYAQSLLYEQAVWNFLLEKEIVKTYPFLLPRFEAEDAKPEENYLFNVFKSLVPQPGEKFDANNLQPDEKGKLQKLLLTRNFTLHDVTTRLDAIGLNQNGDSEFYPFLRTGESFIKQDKKSAVIQFVLNDMPEPDPNTSWEHIIEFRSDEDIKTKYLALINWINKVANSSSTTSDIKDEYEYLYSDYVKHFKLHKMKYNNSMLEVVINAGSSLLLALQTGAFVPAFKNLLEMKLSNIKLMEEEGQLPGKEVAYIFHAKQKF